MVRHPSAKVGDQLCNELEHQLEVHVLRLRRQSRPQQPDRHIRIAGSKHRHHLSDPTLPCRVHQVGNGYVAAVDA
jgi:hypothetical protein